jgi:hypothetical protein
MTQNSILFRDNAKTKFLFYRIDFWTFLKTGKYENDQQKD